MEIVWSDLAIESLVDIVAYIQSCFGKKLADSTARKIIHTVSSIGVTPYIGKKVDSFSQFSDIRCVFYKQNHVYYMVFDNHIEIILVWDGRQDPQRLQNLLVDFLINK